MIKPSIGRRVWFWPGAQQILIGDTPVTVSYDLNQPLDAGVTYVHGDRLINISFADYCGQMHNLTSVPLVQPGDDAPGGSYCTWMDYQITAAAKEEPSTTTAATPASEASLEAEIIAMGLTAQRVTPADIDALMKRVVYIETQQPGGSTSTFVHAFLDGKFLLATGHSACVSAANFRPEVGLTIAKEKAQAQARDRLWELEGYALFKALQAAPKSLPQCTDCKPGDGLCNGYCIGQADAPPVAQAKADPVLNTEGPDDYQG